MSDTENTQDLQEPAQESPERAGPSVPEFFEFHDVFDCIKEGKDVPFERVKSLIAAYASTRYMAVLSNMVEFSSQKHIESNPSHKLHRVKAMMTKRRRIVAAKEVAPEVEGFEGDVMSWQFHAHQKVRRRQLLADALEQAGVRFLMGDRLLDSYIAGVTPLPLREVVRRYKAFVQRLNTADSK